MHVGLGAGSRTGAADLGVGEDLNGLLFDLPRWPCQSLTPELRRTARPDTNSRETAKRSRLKRIVSAVEGVNMLMILIAIVIAGVIAAALFWYSTDGYELRHEVSGAAGLILFLVTGLTAVCYAWAGWSWFAAEHQARIINREYGTHYTQAEVYWAKDVIETVRELDRKRIEVNGDVMRDSPDKRR